MKRPVAWMKVYGANGNYLGSCVEAEGAAALVALAGDGATIRNGHALRNKIWHEGFETQRAGDSYDFVASMIKERLTAPDIIVTQEEAAADNRVQAGLDQARAHVRTVLASISK